jgi:adenosine kinase
MKPTLVVGSLAYDRIMDFDGNFSEHFMPDKLHAINVSFFVSPPKEQFGGCAGNIAYSLSLLEENASIIATAGIDFERYGLWLAEHGIDTESIALDEELPTASGYIMTDKADNQITAFSGGALTKAYERAVDLDAFGLAIISPTAREDMLSLAEKCRVEQLPYLFDPGQQLPVLAPEELRTAIKGARGLFVNDYELALVLEKTGWTETELKGETGFVVVTLGAEGSRILSAEGEEHVPAVPVGEVIDPTGAGDAYRAGFIKGLVHELPLKSCAMLASTVAAYVVEWYGTQNHTFTLPELRARYETAYNESFPLNS